MLTQEQKIILGKLGYYIAFFSLSATRKINTNILRTASGQYGHLRRVRYTVLDLGQTPKLLGELP